MRKSKELLGFFKRKKINEEGKTHTNSEGRSLGFNQ
jgi:hypothetical protein